MTTKTRFKLIIFVDDDPPTIEIVPAGWIFYDQDTGELLCWYWPGALAEKNKKELQKLVKECQPPPSNWKSYRIEIRGTAKTYQEAEMKIHKLQDASYAFSTEDDEKCRQRTEEEKKNYAVEKNSTDPESTKSKFDNARIDLTNEFSEPFNPTPSPLNTSKSSINETTSDEREEEESIKKKELRRSRKRIRSTLGESASTQSAPQSKCPKLDQKRRGDKNETDSSSPEIPKMRKSRENLDPKKYETSPAKEKGGRSDSQRKGMVSGSGDTKKISSTTPKSSRPLLKSISNLPRKNQQLPSKSNPRRLSNYCTFSSEKDHSNNHEDNRHSGKYRSVGEPTQSVPSSPISSNVGQNEEGRKTFPEVRGRSDKLSKNLNRPLRSSNALSRLFEMNEDKLGGHNEVPDDSLVRTLNIMGKQLIDLKGLVVRNGLKIDQIREALRNTSAGEILKSDEEENPDDPNQIDLPCGTLEEYQRFEQKLQTDAVYRRKIRERVVNSIDSKRDKTRWLGDCIRKYMTPAVGELFVPLRATDGKYVFDNSPLCKLIRGAFCRAYGGATSETLQHFKKGIKGVLHNTRSWGGQKKQLGEVPQDVGDGFESDVHVSEED